MKTMRKLASVLLVLVMLFALAMPAAAASITIDGGASGSEYAAYKLLNADTAVEGAGYVFSINDKYEAALIKVYKAANNVAEDAEVTDAQVVDYISKLTVAQDIRDFADAVYAEIKTLEADCTTTNNSFASVDKGYYLIAETKTGAAIDGASDTYSLVMLNTAAEGDDENIKITTKEDVPTLDKSVEEKNDSTGETSWGDEADHDVGDTINYKLVGTVSDRFADYESYYYCFKDTLSAGLTLNTGSIVIKIGETVITEQFTISATESGFTAAANLKELTLPEGVVITGTTEIVVTYSATLNDKAVVGSGGNINTAGLEYNNNPYFEGDGKPETPDKPDEPGKTPEDTTVVFTYQTVVNKTDDLGNALSGAGFTLYKYDAATEDYVAVGDEITGVTTFTFSGLDEGKYKLVETTVPAGYNKAADIEFEIVSTLEGEKLSALKVLDKDGKESTNFTIDVSAGKVETTVVNETGVTLPETGGIGTTLFYIVGGLMVLAAVVLLITKKRMSAE